MLTTYEKPWLFVSVAFLQIDLFEGLMFNKEGLVKHTEVAGNSLRDFAQLMVLWTVMNSIYFVARTYWRFSMDRVMRSLNFITASLILMIFIFNTKLNRFNFSLKVWVVKSRVFQGVCYRTFFDYHYMAWSPEGFMCKANVYRICTLISVQGNFYPFSRFFQTFTMTEVNSLTRLLVVALFGLLTAEGLLLQKQRPALLPDDNEEFLPSC